MPEKSQQQPQAQSQKKSFFTNIKKFSASVWSWIKKNWLTLLIIAAVIFLTTTVLKNCDKEDAYQSLFDQYGDSIESNRQQLRQIQTLQEVERLEQERQIQEFIKEINKVQRQYQDDLEQISSSRSKARNRIVAEARENPTTLTDRIRDTFGIPVEE